MLYQFEEEDDPPDTAVGRGSDIMSDSDLIDVLQRLCSSLEEIGLPRSEGPLSLFVVKP